MGILLQALTLLISSHVLIVSALPTEKLTPNKLLLIPHKRQTTLWASLMNTVVSHHIDDLEKIDKELADHLRLSELSDRDQISEKKWESVNCLVHVVSCFRRRRKRLAVKNLIGS